MDRRLRQLIRDRQRERCPQIVIDRVEQRIGQPSRMLHGRAILTWLAATTCLIGVLYIQREAWQPSPERPSSAPQQIVTEDRQVREVTYASLAYIGKTLIKAGRKSGQIIVQETLPPLQSGFENTKKAISK